MASKAGGTGWLVFIGSRMSAKDLLIPADQMENHLAELRSGWSRGTERITVSLE